MFANLSARLTKVVKNLTGRGRLTEDNIKESLQEVRVALLEADVALPVVKQFLAAVQEKAVGKEVLHSIRPGDAFVKIVYDEMVTIMGGTASPLNFNSTPPVVIMVMGLQGSGKTTTIAKLAHWLRVQQKKSVLVTSADIYRPAAIEQLQILAQQIAVDFFPSRVEDDPVAIAKGAIAHAKIKFIDSVIIDTAGRLHIDQEMMAELKRIQQAVQPTEALLVVDSMLGQDAVNIAHSFSATLPLTGIVLTKADGDARGGAALAMRIITQQPIKFVGIGEKVEALELFYPERIASRILGMGDILTLVEEAQHKVDQEQAKKLVKKFQKGKSFDFEDFLIQLQQIRNLGGAGGILSKLPNMGNLGGGKLDLSDKMFNKMEAIINSMTPKERHFPAFIKGSHKQRIARGSGTQVQDINRLLKQFEQIKKMMQRFNGSKAMNMMKKMNFPLAR